MKKQNKTKGFTLIELLVVISIIGLLSSVVLASLVSTRDRAKVAKYQQEKHQADLFLSLYQAEYGGFPYGTDSAYCIADSSAPQCLLFGVTVPNIRSAGGGNTISLLLQNVQDRINLLAAVAAPKFKNDTTIKVGDSELRGIIYIPCQSPSTVNGRQVCIQDETTSVGSAAVLVYPGRSSTGGISLKQSVVGVSGNESNYATQ